MTSQTPSSDAAVRALLKHITHADHDRGCQGRSYDCSCGYDDRTADLAEAADAALFPVPQVSEDLASVQPATGEWVMVPREPTREMWAASGDAVVNLRLAMNHDKVSDIVWRAMIAAAPPPTQPQAEVMG